MTLFALPSSNSTLWDPSKVSLVAYNAFHANTGRALWIYVNQTPNPVDRVNQYFLEKCRELPKTIPWITNFVQWNANVACNSATVITCWFFFLRIMDASFSFSALESALTPARVTHFEEGWIPNPKGPYFLIAALLVALNATKFLKEMMNKSDIEEETDSFTDRFLAVVWKATPYLMIITNLVVAALHIYKGHSEYWITLAVTGVTLLPITNLMPKSFNRYLDNAGFPIDAAAFWFGDYYMRRSIIIGAIFRGIF